MSKAVKAVKAVSGAKKEAKKTYTLTCGDVYMMEAKAVGFDWLKRNVPTARHATGCDEFTDPKP